ncbi:prolyl-tRNA synthetase [Massarina eburnea CBS 473.64]|uniref:proline--tRNA ligase n=1 Tax=Massarina eburnea CBS 473.64 TaxID=1395130 RepID=A0A6A6RRL6_9PLEO|nr:prolyl-tRNA synthetase [Massarina eburnea CBS 473.64]
MKAQLWRGAHRAQLPLRRVVNARFLVSDSRNRLSNFWAPTGGIAAQDGEQDDSHALLIRSGFLRQAHSGVFHLLPLGLRVQNKLECLIDKHMRSVGASKLSLSSITTEELWKQSGRYSANSELLRIKDRRNSGFLLSPTHEEEITSLVASIVNSYKQLPLRLYQTGRKYRDERRPRQGLLRAKEFMMKDLYTFDSSHEEALKSYEDVRKAYNNLFDEFKIPYLVADADSGNMGGKLSHEYHFVSPKGEDNVWSCKNCDYVANEELAEKGSSKDITSPDVQPLVFTGISTDRTTAIQIHVPRPPHIPIDENPVWDHASEFINFHAVKKAGIDIDAGIESATLAPLLPKATSTISIHDRSLSKDDQSEDSNPTHDFTPIKPEDPCPRCSSGKLTSSKAIEVGHTFHLGTRYSEPLSAIFSDGRSGAPQRLHMHMGCHGIGVSRLIGSMASLLSDRKGLNWPRVIAPFEVVVVATPKVQEGHDVEVYDKLVTAGDGINGIDVVLDDRPAQKLSWKLTDADLIGYPVIVVLGKWWEEKRMVEVQCRRLGFKQDVGIEELRGKVVELLEQL